MFARLKGLNQLTKRLADGSLKTYWYAWKGGPALNGEPGSPEFIASYHKCYLSEGGAGTRHADEADPRL